MAASMVRVVDLILWSTRTALALSQCPLRSAGAMEPNFITEAWFVNERTNGDWVRSAVRAGDRVQYGTITDAALAELALAAGNTTEDAMDAVLLRVVRTFARMNPGATVPVIQAPVIWE
jgi:hypothetical protein